eukprot:TRINITY_DN21167_c0_g1_i1.p1 TRINITY_DN21167_c0_g1~~TRINITY_DN21167_c0_g1_i1.p1  ORF type:complete len:577 (+),score=200.66 TRINITY_DN21167_c0_g1_i1:47-1777(+)
MVDGDPPVPDVEIDDLDARNDPHDYTPPTLNLERKVTEAPPVTVDDLYEAAGGLGPYNKRAVAFGVLCSFIVGQHVMSGYFATLELSLECAASEGCADEITMFEYCAAKAGEGEFVGLRGEVIMQNWTVVGRARGVTHDLAGCAPEGWMAPLVGSMFFVGWLLGGFTAGSLSDKIGRLATSYIMLAGSAAVYLLSTLAPSMSVYYLFKVLHGVFVGGLSLSSYVYAVECVPVKAQGALGTLVMGAFGVGCILLVPMAYYLTHWKAFTVTVSLVNLLTVAFVPFLEKSPRWVAAQAGLRSAAFAKVIAYICSANGAPVSKITAMIGSGGEDAASPPSPHEAKPSAGRLLATVYCAFAELRKRTLIMNLFWFTCAFTYYGLNYAAGDLGGGLYVNAFIIVLVEFPAYFLAAWGMDSPRLGRKQTSFWSFVLTALCCFAAAFTSGGVKRCVGFVGKLAITISFTVAYIWAGEVFSTDVRSTAMGTATSAARVGGLLAPLVSSAGMATAGPIYGAAAVLVAWLCIYLPETRGKQLPETLEDIRSYNRLRSASMETTRSDDLVRIESAETQANPLPGDSMI